MIEPNFQSIVITNAIGLMLLVSLLASSVPDSALVARFAGDEFIVLLAGSEATSVETARSSIEKALDELNASSDKPYELSLSIGTITFDPGTDTIDDFLRHVDERMYEQKRQHHASVEAEQTEPALGEESHR